MRLETTSELILVFLAGIAILFLSAGYLIYFIFLYHKNQQRNIAERKDREIHFQKQLLQSQLEIKEQTLQHIALELHDNLGQIASLIKINLNTLQLRPEDQAKQKIEETKEFVRQLIGDLKLLSLNLNSDRIAQIGILKGLENEIERINKTGQIRCILSAESVIPSLDSNKTIILFRMMQEILNNAINHSQAKQLTIDVRASEKMFTLVYHDDGIGFKVDERMGSGSGLVNLQTRAELIGARISIDSMPSQGSRISIELQL